jgi:hypothetical protein
MVVGIIIVALLAVPILWLCYLASTAPVGYEDSQGWHPGEPDDNDDCE